MQRASGPPLALVLLLLAASGPAAADNRAEEAKAAYERGMAHYNLEEWDAAIEQFEAGYRVKPAPEFLFNIGQAYRLSGRADKALSFYQKYLKIAPRAGNRAEVEAHIAALRARLEAQAHEPAAPVSRPPAAAPPPPPPAPPPPGATPPSPTAAAPAATPATGTPVYKKGWFWGVIGGVVAVGAGAGITAGVLASQGATIDTLPAARFTP